MYLKKEFFPGSHGSVFRGKHVELTASGPHAQRLRVQHACGSWVQFLVKGTCLGCKSDPCPRLAHGGRQPTDVSVCLSVSSPLPLSLESMEKISSIKKGNFVYIQQKNN